MNTNISSFETEVVGPSQSECASSIVVVPEKKGTPPIWVNYWRLISATILDTYPLPRMDDCTNSLDEAQVKRLRHRTH